MLFPNQEVRMSEQMLRRVPANKGMRYPADPPTVEEIVAVMRQAGQGRTAARLRGVIVVLWRAGLRINEAIMLNETDLSPSAGSITVRFGKGGRRREVGMDGWGWEHLRPWLEQRQQLPPGRLFCVINGSSAGQRWSSSAVRGDLRRLAERAGVRRRFAPHQLRHAHAVEIAREGIPLNVIQRQLGHANLGVTSIYLQGIDNSEIIATVSARPHPVMPASAGLRLLAR
jgi:site-specific recombinase XerD